MYRKGAYLNSHFRVNQAAGSGSEHGEHTNIAGTESWKRRDQIARYRVLEQETTDPLAVLLLHDIVLELEADVREPKADGVEDL